MSEIYIRHIVAEMDESMLQCCIICGAVINDYRNAMWPAGQGAPTGFAAGLVYVSQLTNPTNLKTFGAMSDEELKNVVFCK